MSAAASGPAVAFRRARQDDVPAIVALIADDAIGRLREIGGTVPDRQYGDAFAAIEKDPNQFLAVAELAGQVVGCLQLTFIPGLSLRGTWRGQIEAVRIAASHRGAGLGTRLLAWAVAMCRERGCGMVQLTSDKRRVDAIRFYERMGFQASHAGMKLAL
jgi:ribosomal protein S18 acetylase RimI-like enzyme